MPGQVRDTKTWYTAKVINPAVFQNRLSRNQTVYFKRSGNPKCWVVFSGSEHDAPFFISNEDAKKGIVAIRNQKTRELVLARSQKDLTARFNWSTWGMTEKDAPV